jgi:hypothetical protein
VKLEKIRYTVNNVIQNKTKFYSLTMPTDVLSKSCFVSSRDEDPIMGFQCTLDEKRALEIANWIDNEEGMVPSSIILDGQHRVYEFSKAKSTLRVPVLNGVAWNLSGRNHLAAFNTPHPTKSSDFEILNQGTRTAPSLYACWLGSDWVLYYFGCLV